MEEKQFKKLDLSKPYSFKSKYEKGPLASGILIFIINPGYLLIYFAIMLLFNPETKKQSLTGGITLFIVGVIMIVIFLFYAIYFCFYFNYRFKVKTKQILQNGKITTGNIPSAKSYTFLSKTQHGFKYKTAYTYIDDKGAEHNDFYYFYYPKKNYAPNDTTISVIFFNGDSMRLGNHTPLDEP